MSEALFRKRPVVVEAMPWDDNIEDLRAWGAPATRLPASDGLLIIGTLEDGPNCEAVHIADPGDWIIKGVKGEFYPCKPDIFHATYEPALDDGAVMILTERRRQIAVEGYDVVHDDDHDRGEILRAALCYAAVGLDGVRQEQLAVDEAWPWETRSWKPSLDPVRNLTKAGALIAAEIDRILRARGQAV